MGWTELVLDLAVILGALVRILDQQANGGTGGEPLENPGQDFHLVTFATLGGEAGSAGFAAIQVTLDVRLGQRHSRGTAINNAAEGRPVAFAKAGDGE